MVFGVLPFVGGIPRAALSEKARRHRAEAADLLDVPAPPSSRSPNRGSARHRNARISALISAADDARAQRRVGFAFGCRIRKFLPGAAFSRKG